MENISSYLTYLKGYDFTGKSPVIIDCYATWCGPCKALSPLIERLAHEYKGRIKVLKVDVDKNRAFAQAARIMSVPTLFFIDIDGDIQRHVGVLMYEDLSRKASMLVRS